MLKDISNKVKGGYLLWVVLHMLLLIFNLNLSETWRSPFYVFFPFERDVEWSIYQKKFVFIDLWRSYDITEFLLYLIVPVLLYFAYKLLRPQPEPEPKEDE